MIKDAARVTGTGPKGQRETTTDSSVTSLHPHAGTLEKSLPGPAKTQPRTPLPTASSQRGAMSVRLYLALPPDASGLAEFGSTNA